MLAGTDIFHSCSQQIVVDTQDGVGVREEGLAWEDAAQSDGTIVQCRNIKSSIILKYINRYNRPSLIHCLIVIAHPSLVA